MSRVPCPICGNDFPEREIERHAGLCVELQDRARRRGARPPREVPTTQSLMEQEATLTSTSVKAPSVSIDVGGVLFVHVVRARNLSKNSGFGKLASVCEASFEGESHRRTSLGANHANPEWNARFIFNVTEFYGGAPVRVCVTAKGPFQKTITRGVVTLPLGDAVPERSRVRPPSPGAADSDGPGLTNSSTPSVIRRSFNSRFGFGRRRLLGLSSAVDAGRHFGSFSPSPSPLPAASPVPSSAPSPSATLSLGVASSDDLDLGAYSIGRRRASGSPSAGVAVGGGGGGGASPARATVDGEEERKDGSGGPALRRLDDSDAKWDDGASAAGPRSTVSALLASGLPSVGAPPRSSLARTVSNRQLGTGAGEASGTAARSGVSSGSRTGAAGAGTAAGADASAAVSPAVDLAGPRATEGITFHGLEAEPAWFVVDAHGDGSSVSATAAAAAAAAAAAGPEQKRPRGSSGGGSALVRAFQCARSAARVRRRKPVPAASRMPSLLVRTVYVPLREVASYEVVSGAGANLAWNALHRAAADDEVALLTPLAHAAAHGGHLWRRTGDAAAMTALDIACLRGHLRSARVILGMMKAPPMSRAPDSKRTCLHFAALGGNTAVASLLVDGLQRTASRVGRVRRQRLVEAGLPTDTDEQIAAAATAHINAQDAQGHTAVAVAASRGDTAMVRMLVNRGADPAIVNVRGDTPLMLAIRGGHTETAAHLLGLSGSSPTAHGSGAKLWLARPLARNNTGITALYCAAGAGDVRLVDMLVSLGARRDTATDEGRTPLHAAAAGGHLEVVRALTLTSKAPGSPTALDKGGKDRDKNAAGVIDKADESPTAEGAPVAGAAAAAAAAVAAAAAAAAVVGAAGGAVSHQTVSPRVPAIDKGIGDDGRGGYHNPRSRRVSVLLVDAHGRTPLVDAREGKTQGHRAIAALLEALEAAERARARAERSAQPPLDGARGSADAVIARARAAEEAQRRAMASGAAAPAGARGASALSDVDSIDVVLETPSGASRPTLPASGDGDGDGFADDSDYNYFTSEDEGDG